MKNKHLIVLAVVVLATFYIGLGMGMKDQKKKDATILRYWYDRTYDTYFHNFVSGEVEAGRCFNDKEIEQIENIIK